jgi:ABC-type polysaccharide/polyol phosphate export permease
MRSFLRFNPMSHILVAYQQILFDGDFHHWEGLGSAALAALATFAVGAFLFERLRDTLAEEV